MATKREGAVRLPEAIEQQIDSDAQRTARGLWDFISGDCFGMTPDPWVCWDESSGDGCERQPHGCTDSTARLTAHLKPILRELAEAAYRAGQSEGRRERYAFEESYWKQRAAPPAGAPE